MAEDITRLQEKIGADLQFLLECLHEVLLELKERDIAAIIPWMRDFKNLDHHVPTERSCQLYSISIFNFSEWSRKTLRFRCGAWWSENGLSSERGLWGNTLF